MTTSAITVVLFQFWVFRGSIPPPFLMMAIGTVFYMIGFTCLASCPLMPVFAAAIVIITIGEMIVVPTSQSLAANFAPEDMRGRYMAVFGLSWAIPRDWTRCSRLYPGQLQPEPALVHRRSLMRNISAGLLHPSSEAG